MWYLEIFPYGCGSSDEQRLTKLELKAYMANVLWLSSRQFAQHHAFPLITFDMLVYNHAITSVYVHYKVRLIDAM